MFKKRMWLGIILSIIFLIFSISGFTAYYKYTQESGADFYVSADDKADALEDTNEVRQILDDLGALVVHSKRDGVYPKGGDFGGTIQIPEAGLKFGNDPSNNDIAAYIDGEMMWRTKAELSIQLLDATLTAFAGLTIGANELIYGTGADAFSMLGVNATATNKFLRQVSSGVPAWATLVAGDIPDISATYQPLDTALTNISALAYVSPSLIKLTAEDTYAVRTLAEIKTDLAYQLSDMSDVGVTTPTDKYVLVADGDSWESRALVEADISDLGSYLEDITGESIGDLSDVDLTDIANLKILQYNSTSGNWECEDPGAGAGDMLKATYDNDEDGDIDVAAGGTEKSLWTLYAIPYLSGTTAFGEIPIGTAGQVLKVSAGATGYEFANESDPTVDTDAEIKAILVDEVTKTGDFTANRLPEINNSSGILEQSDIEHKANGGYDFNANSAGFTTQIAIGDGTTTCDWRIGPKLKFRFGEQNETFSFTNPEFSCHLQIILIQDATGSKLATWPAGIFWAGGTIPTLSTAANARDIVNLFFDDDDDVYYGMGAGFAVP